MTAEKSDLMFADSALLKTQADGTFSIDTRETSKFKSQRVLNKWQVHVEISATPSAGSLTLAVKSQGATAYQDLSGTIDLVNGPYIKTFEVVADSIQVTPSGFDADKTYSVYFTAV